MVNVIVRVLDGSSRSIEIDASSSIDDLKSCLAYHTMIPSSHQRLIINSRLAYGSCTLTDYQSNQHETIFATLLLSLKGGKGGFGTLLRTSARADTATDRGDMRDLQGRRLRDVEQMKELEEWKKKQAAAGPLTDAQKREREREYRAKLAEIERTGGRERKRCKYGIDCRYQSTTCHFYHPDEEKSAGHSSNNKRLKSRVDSDSDDDDDDFDGNDDVFAVHAEDEEKVQSISNQPTKQPFSHALVNQSNNQSNKQSINQASKQSNRVANHRSFDNDDLLGFDSEEESSPSSTEFQSVSQPLKEGLSEPRSSQSSLIEPIA